MTDYAANPPWQFERRRGPRWRRTGRGKARASEPAWTEEGEGRRRHGPPWAHHLPPGAEAMAWEHVVQGMRHGPGGWGYGPRGPRRRRGGARRGDVRAAILALLAEQPMHGYQIIQEISRRSDGVWTPSPGAVYPALAQLEDEGLVRMAEEGGRKVFHLTEEGQRYVTDHPDEVGQPWEAVTGSVSNEALDAKMVLGQIGMAYFQVIQTGDAAMIEQARQVLVDARRRLYRLLANDSDAPPEA